MTSLCCVKITVRTHKVIGIPFASKVAESLGVDDSLPNKSNLTTDIFVQLTNPIEVSMYEH